MRISILPGIDAVANRSVLRPRVQAFTSRSVAKSALIVHQGWRSVGLAPPRLYTMAVSATVTTIYSSASGKAAVIGAVSPILRRMPP
jgi:hypothetical protein